MYMDILIIEDDKYLREAYIEILSLEGHRVLGVSNVSDALAQLDSLGFDLVISDANLGMQDAVTSLFEAFYSIKSRGTQVMVISGNASVQDACSQYGFAFLLKPFSPTELLRSIPGV